MHSADFIFQISPYDMQLLLPQVSKALEKRTEMASRKACPGIWKQTDRLNALAKGRSPRRTRARSVVFLVLGIFLLVPGIMEPRELLLPLVMGALAVCAGGAGLWRSFRRKENPFDQPAARLLSGLSALPQEHLCLSFAPEGMTISAKEEKDGTVVPWHDFESVVETADAILLSHGDRVTLLQKKDLVSGTEEDLRAFLQDRIREWYSV